MAEAQARIERYRAERESAEAEAQKVGGEAVQSLRELADYEAVVSKDSCTNDAHLLLGQPKGQSNSCEALEKCNGSNDLDFLHA